MTQQEIVDYVNRLTVGYHINWYDIQYDADKAILRINAFLGTSYPPMSKILRGREDTYSLVTNGKRRDIFPDMYIVTVVIPFVAMEVLSRDEEFTTVYNKYAQDVEDGLFTMFQNEYNRVPQCFRQSKDVGVFFEKDSYANKFHPNSPYLDNKKCEHNNFTFRVNYHYNLDDAIITEQVYDNCQYEYGTNVKIKEPNIKTIHSSDGLCVYTFEGYSYSKDDYNIISDDEISFIESDIDLYMQWKRVSLFDCSNDEFNCKSTDTNILKGIKHLVVPVAINGRLVKSINKNMISQLTNLQSIKLPETLTIIKSGTFTNFKGDTIELADTMAACELENNAFNLSSSNVYDLVIPTRYIPKNSSTIFTTNKKLTIKFRTLKENSSFNDTVYFNGDIIKEWGYNG